jgi:putative endopeptidase
MLRALRLILVLLVAAVVGGVPAALAAQVTTPVSQPATPVAGVANGSLGAAMDQSVPPGQDFYRYATGRWQDSATIPSDRAAYGISDELDDVTIEQLLGLLNRLSASDALPEGSDEWKAVQLFAQGIDYDTRNAQGIEPIANDLARIAAISTLDELYTFLREGVLTSNASGLYGVSAGADLEDSSIYTLWYGGPALGLPNRDYYWANDAANEPIREAYRATGAKLLGFAGYDEAEATATAQRVYDFEKRLAEPLLRPADANDPAN